MNSQTPKVPRRNPSSRVERALAKTARDGAQYKILTMGATTAEQIARSYNVQGASWELAWAPGVEKGEIVSYLYARWVGPT